MNRKTVLTGILTITIIAVWNSKLFLDWKNFKMGRLSATPTATTENLNEPQLWRDIKKTSVEENQDGEFEPRFDPSVLAVEGQRVALPGVGFLLSSGLSDNKDGKEEVTEFLLLPGDGGVAWCCGLTPIPNHEFSVLVDCGESPLLASRVDPKTPGFFVNVEGTLRLQTDNSINSLYTLEDVAIEFIEMKDVLPPNVMNLCLNQPMAQ